MSSLLAISPSPVFSQVSSFPSRGGPVPLVDLTATGYHRHGDLPAVRIPYLPIYSPGLTTSSAFNLASCI